MAAMAFTMKVSGVDELATMCETISDRAHARVLPEITRDSANRLNSAIVKNIPVGPRGRKGDTGGWRKAQAQLYAEFIAAGERDATVYAVPLPTHEVLGLREEAEQAIFYPYIVEYGSHNLVAQAPIRSAVNAEGDREFRQMGRLLGKNFVGLAQAIAMGRATPKAIRQAARLDILGI